MSWIAEKLILWPRILLTRLLPKDVAIIADKFLQILTKEYKFVILNEVIMLILQEFDMLFKC